MCHKQSYDSRKTINMSYCIVARREPELVTKLAKKKNYTNTRLRRFAGMSSQNNML